MEDWLSVDREAYTSMWRFGLKHPLAVTVLNFMVSKMTRGDAGVVMSSLAMARQMEVSERSIKTAIGALRDAKFVQILKSGNTNVYIVNSQVAWRGKRGQRFATFNTRLMIDEKEQKASVEELEAEARELVNVPIMDIQALDGIQKDDPLY